MPQRTCAVWHLPIRSSYMARGPSTTPRWRRTAPATERCSAAGNGVPPLDGRDNVTTPHPWGPALEGASCGPPRLPLPPDQTPLEGLSMNHDLDNQTRNPDA